MAFDYSKLKGRIVEKYDSQSSFANAMEWSERYIVVEAQRKAVLEAVRYLQGSQSVRTFC